MHLRLRLVHKIRKALIEDGSVLNERFADNASIEISGGPEIRPCWQNQRGAWLLFAEGYESTESDHAEAGSYSLVAAETRTGSQACAKRGSKRDDEEVGSGVQPVIHMRQWWPFRTNAPKLACLPTQIVNDIGRGRSVPQPLPYGTAGSSRSGH
jgi:hypothetical protein